MFTAIKKVSTRRVRRHRETLANLGTPTVTLNLRALPIRAVEVEDLCAAVNVENAVFASSASDRNRTGKKGGGAEGELT